VGCACATDGTAPGLSAISLRTYGTLGKRAQTDNREPTPDDEQDRALISVASAGPSAFWYLTRGTGTVAVILLTLSLALGVADVRRVRSPRVLRFVVDAVHRNASLLAVAFVVVHIATSLLDGFAPIRLLDIVVPFGSAYRPLWLGFGAVAFDLLLAVTITSLLRRRLGYRAWRATHWAAYACWPVALVHGLGTGSDAKTLWTLAITGGCVIVVIVAVVSRAVAGWPAHAGARVTALVASALIPIGLLAWLPSGPLADGWARRAGTPRSLLPTATALAAVATVPPGAGTTGSQTSFTSALSGTVHRARVDDGLYEIHLSLTVSGQRLSTLGVRIYGHRLAGGGVQMTSSRVELGTSSDPRLYRGQITGLAGTEITAEVADARGSRLALDAQTQLSPAGDQAGGTLLVRPWGP
jgi:sulfoxide reductase heme-binding subunit YedZ